MTKEFKIKIENYKKLLNREIQFNKYDCIYLMGPNNTGKSTTLNAFNALLNSKQTKTVLQKNIENQQPHNTNKKSKITLFNYIDDTNKEEKLVLTVDEQDEFLKSLKNLNLYDGVIKIGFENDGVDKTNTNNINNELKNELNNIEVELNFKNENQDKDENEIEEEECETLTFTSFASDVAKKLALFTQQLEKNSINSDTDLNKYITNINNIMSENIGINDFKLTFQYSEENFEDALNKLISESSKITYNNGKEVETLGDGAKRIFSIATLLDSNIQNHVILFEEPETWLHPSAIIEIRKTIEKLKQNNLMIVSTHSSRFFDIFDDATYVKMTDETSFSIIMENEIPDKNERDIIKMLNRINPEIFDGILGNSVIVVEGDTEYMAIKTAELNKMISIKSNETLINALSPTNIKSILMLCKALHIETHVIMDRDCVNGYENSTLKGFKTRNNDVIKLIAEMRNQGNNSTVTFQEENFEIENNLCTVEDYFSKKDTLSKTDAAYNLFKGNKNPAFINTFYKKDDKNYNIEDVKKDMESVFKKIIQ